MARKQLPPPEGVSHDDWKTMKAKWDADIRANRARAKKRTGDVPWMGADSGLCPTGGSFRNIHYMECLQEDKQRWREQPLVDQMCVDAALDGRRSPLYLTDRQRRMYDEQHTALLKRR